MLFNSFNPLSREFYTRNDVVQIARDLLGKVLYTSVGNEITAGIIVETEAYAGIIDKASHAYNNRRTSRTEIMFGNGGHAYVYLCYGVHSLFNIVTSTQSDPHAVLIRGIDPLLGFETMKLRSGKSVLSSKSGIGPGNISKLLGIKVAHSGVDLCPVLIKEGIIWLQDEEIMIPEEEIISGPRIGIDYAGEDALLPYRFQWLKNKKAPGQGAFYEN
jgi:DNA-3-methyladenine glycosylase